MEIKATTESNPRLFGWPSPKPNPPIFKPTVSLGVPANLTPYDELKDEHWESLAPLVGLFHVVLSLSVTYFQAYSAVSQTIIDSGYQIYLIR